MSGQYAQKPGTLIPILDTNPLSLLFILVELCFLNVTSSAWQPELDFTPSKIHSLKFIET